MKTHHSILLQRGSHLLSSVLVFTAQRLPFLKSLSPLFSPNTLRFAVPIAVQTVATDCLSGQSVKVSPVGESTDSETVNQGDDFVWLFQTTGRTARSYSVTGLPEGLTFNFGSPISFISGTPTEAGNFSIQLVGWRFANQSGNQTPPFTLNLSVTAALSPFDSWRAGFWNEEELADPNISGPSADPDEDGIENSLEFVLGFDPNQPETFPGNLRPDPDDPNTLLFSVPVSDEGSPFLEFQQNSDLSADGWTPLREDDPAVEIIESENLKSLRIDRSAATKSFFRVAVTL